MAKKYLKKIFLSASIPDPERNKKYYESADITAIRDSVRALASVVIPNYGLVWGGHPSITPMIRFVLDKMGGNVKDYVTLYQSKYFQEYFPEDNFSFENIVLTDIVNNSREESLAHMRTKMLQMNDFEAGFFIGGMEGIELEYNLFKKYNPNALALPIASTGGASQIIYTKMNNRLNNERLSSDYAYFSLFSDLLSNINR